MNISHVELREVSQHYQATDKIKNVLNKISFTVTKGSFLCIVGPSGCGKSTLLDLIGGFLLPSTGEVLINGKSVSGPQTSTISVFQNHALFPWKTALHNVTYGLELSGISRKNAEARALELLKTVGLSGFEKFYPAQLSGGMKQRVALARALAVEPELVLMDEPLGALDVLTRMQMQKELEQTWQTFKQTAILVTHDVEEAVFLGDQVIVLSGSPTNIQSTIAVNLARPRNRLSFEFIEFCSKIYKSLGIVY